MLEEAANLSRSVILSEPGSPTSPLLACWGGEAKDLLFAHAEIKQILQPRKTGAAEG
jgi:hypothetical protein